MGNTQSPQKTQSKYSYFQSYQDSHFGQCTIHRNNYSPNQFAIPLSQYFPQQQAHKIQQNLKSFQTNYLLTFQQFPFLKIIDWKVSHSELNFTNKLVNTCNMPQITIWIQFLRHNLKDFLEWRKTQNRPLSHNEVIMALNKAIQAYQMTKSNQLFGVSLNLEDISINIEGQMKFNPLLGNSLIKKLASQNSRFISCQAFPLRDKILQRKNYQSQKENINPKYIISKQYRYLSPQFSQESDFLAQLKLFANQLVWDSTQHIIDVKNPEDLQFDERKQTKRFLNQFHRVKGIKQAKKFIGQSTLNLFHVDFAKLKHEESQAKFKKIFSQIQQRSQKTDYSYYESSTYISPNKNSKKHQFITSQYYHYS